MRSVRTLVAFFLAILLFSPALAANADTGTADVPGTSQSPGDPADTPSTTPAGSPATSLATDTPATDEPATARPTNKPGGRPAETPSDTPSDEDTPSAADTDKPAARRGAAAKARALAAAPAAPDAADDNYTVATNGTLVKTAVSGVFKNDSDGALTFTIVDNVDHGTLTQLGLGAFTYKPASGYTGTDTFTYTYTPITGSHSGVTSNVATVTITVGSNTPVAANDHYVMSPGDTLETDFPGVFGNDSGVGLLGFTVDSPVSHGTFSKKITGGFTYTPASGFSGIDTFSYHFFDATVFKNSNTATVTIVVGDPPTAQDDSYTTDQGALLTTPAPGIFDNDSTQTGTLNVLSPTPNGVLTNSADGSFTYKPNPGFAGSDSFTYSITDPVTLLVSNVATATITVAPVPAPVANDDSYAVASGALLTVASPGIYGNDSIQDGVGTVVTDVQHGTLTLSADGSFTYTPTAGFGGTDTFVYKVEDADTGLTSNDATVTLHVVPVAVSDDYSVSTCDVVEVSPLDNDLQTASSAGPELIADVRHGTLSPTSADTAVYTPDDGFVGDDSFTYTYDSNGEKSNVATATIHVLAGHCVGGDSALPDTGTHQSPWAIMFAGLMMIAGVVMVRSGRAKRA